ncbi:prepilin-type N-terminal cleavage/methylation domain-containing protein [Pseudobythopirellula maris]|nr:prepilin-type N-terminal cleavage/methylation domain-containing protein [Pseudobythopirellula maris]
MNKTKKNGFTLVELVVVILVLGILAGVAAPKFLSTSSEAVDNGLQHTLTIVRDAIEIYIAKNDGAKPPSDSGANFVAAIEPYIRGSFPVCPVGPAKNATVEIVTAAGGDAVPTAGWAYNSTDQTFFCNYSAELASKSGIDYDEL